MDIDAYLDRLGVARPASPDLATLRHLQERHLAAVPFENLSSHLGEPVVLAEDALFAKIVGRRRGGFCYELNGLFAALLRALGYDASLRAAQVFRPDGTVGPPLDHAAIVVSLDAEDWLVDVGFGRFARHPLRLSAVDAQPDACGEFLILDAPHGDVDILLDGKPQYRLERRPRPLADFIPMAWWQTTSPESHFTQSLTCSRPTGDHSRVTISDRLLITTVAGKRTEATLGSDAEVLGAYREHFGFTLDRLPTPPAS